ncbi:MAG: cyclodeaminase/cyclohydrolase family protein [Desulfomonilaceae bacterium]
MSSTFLEQLAEPRPFPGGGSAASYVGALALALVEKVVRLEMKRCEVDTEATVIWSGRLSSAAKLTAKFRLLFQEDGRAYARMSRVRAHVSEADVILAAVRDATLVPLQIIHAAAQGCSLISEISRECKTYLVPDLQVSCELLWAVARGAEAIASANVMLMESATNRTELHAMLIEAVKDTRDVHTKTKAVLEANAPCRYSPCPVGDD